MYQSTLTFAPSAMAAQPKPPIKTLATFPVDLKVNGITGDCSGNIIVSVQVDGIHGDELVRIPVDGNLPQQLLRHEDIYEGVRDIAVSPDGKELYVLGDEIGIVSQYLFPWGSQPAKKVLKNMDFARRGPLVGRIICDRPG
jgi:hypothetical protein